MGAPQSTKRKSIQKWLRASRLIARQLALPAEVFPTPDIELLVKQINDAKRRVEICISKRWTSAEQAVADYQRQLRRLTASLEKELAKPIGIGFQLDEVAVFQDLMALEVEFSNVKFDLKEKLLAVTTTEIALGGEELGAFSIVLQLDALGSSRGVYYEVHPVDPNWASSEDGVAHPHVHDNQLCEGDGKPAIKLAWQQGRLLDFFQIVEQVLGNYNPSSAYVAISDWHGNANCDQCGDTASASDLYTCSCDASVCDDCTYGCNSCSNPCCGNCNNTCQGCLENVCTDCIRSCDRCDESMCSDCLNDTNGRCEDCEKIANEEAGAGDTQAPVHADGMGQVAVPA